MSDAMLTDMFKDFVTTESGRLNWAFAPYVDQCYRYQFAAASKEYPEYDHAEYERLSDLFKAALLCFTNGDQQFADAFYHFFLDSGENVMWYTRKLRAGKETRNDFCYDAGTITHDEWYNSLPVVVEWPDIDPMGQGCTYTDRYSDLATARQAIADAIDNGHKPGRIIQGA